jgi:hypothetical protein
MSPPVHTLDLPALDGANPLGFLAALGTLTVLAETDPTLKLGWHARARWVPFLVSDKPLEENEILQRLVVRLRGQQVDAGKEASRKKAQERFDGAKKALKDSIDRFKKLGLRGKERDEARAREIGPQDEALRSARTSLLGALKEAVPSPELALGQRPDCTIDEFRETARTMLGESRPSTRTTADLLASFGTELSNDAEQRIAPTFFCFITGSGHQWFLDTARELMSRTTESKLREALFQPWAYTDEKLTMRWDPLDDRRYALMDKDPTASDNKSTTIWMANLLAYFALANFPCVATSCGPATSAWRSTKDSNAFTWPVWRSSLTRSAICSLLSHPALAACDDVASTKQSRTELLARGVAAIFSARRIQVGNPPLHKINFSPTIAR